MGAPSGVYTPRIVRRLLLEHVRELGWTESSLYRGRARAAVRDEVIAPLARYGIEIAPERVTPLLA